MRFEDIDYAMAIARAGGVARAAQQLGISQPALSKALARLEAELKTRLFERSVRGARLTDEGRLFLRHATRAALHAADARAALRDRRLGASGLVRLGVGIGVPGPPIAEACAALADAGPVRFEIRSGMSDSLLEVLRSGELDVIVSGIPRPAGNDLLWTPLWPDPMLPHIPRSNPLAAQPRRWSLKNLREQRWLLPPVGTVARGHFDSAFISAGLTPPEPVVESRDSNKDGDLSLALGAVIMLPLSLSRHDARVSEFAVVRSVPALRLERTVSLLSRRASYVSPVVKRFIGLLRAHRGAAPVT